MREVGLVEEVARPTTDNSRQQVLQILDLGTLTNGCSIDYLRYCRRQILRMCPEVQYSLKISF